MEDPEQLNVNTTAFVIFLLILSALGILWTVFCSWLTGRKKRQRVGNNGNVEDLVLDLTSPMTSAKGRSSGRYSRAEQTIIFPINDLGQSLRVPTIVITPPTPLDTPVEGGSLRSDSSIGTAEDLIQANGDISDEIDPSDETITETANGMLIKQPYIRDSMRNILASGQSSDERSVALQEFCSITGVAGLGQDIADSSESCSTACSRLADSPAVLVINGSHVNNDNDDNEDEFSIDDNSPRPRLSSMEPGTKKPDFQLSDGKLS